MRIAIIGSTGLTPIMYEHKAEMESKGHIVTMPVFDKDSNDELQLTTENKFRIMRSDQVHLIWDGRSPGTILDLGIILGLGKTLKIIYLETMSIPKMIRKYAELYKDENY